MPKKYTVAEEIRAQAAVIAYMERTLPAARKAGTMSQEHVDMRLGCAKAPLKRLTIIEKQRPCAHAEE